MSVAGGDDTVSVNLLGGHRGDWQVQLRNSHEAWPRDPRAPDWRPTEPQAYFTRWSGVDETTQTEFNVRLRSSIVYRPTCNLGRGGGDEPPISGG
jgi:hypothetical protein